MSRCARDDRLFRACPADVVVDRYQQVVGVLSVFSRRLNSLTSCDGERRMAFVAVGGDVGVMAWCAYGSACRGHGAHGENDVYARVSDAERTARRAHTTLRAHHILPHTTTAPPRPTPYAAGGKAARSPAAAYLHIYVRTRIHLFHAHTHTCLTLPG